MLVTAKPFKVYSDEVQLLSEKTFKVYRGSDIAISPGTRVTRLFRYLDSEPESDMVEMLLYNPTDKSVQSLSKACPYGALGSVFWVKEPFYLYTGKKRFVSYIDQPKKKVEGYSVMRVGPDRMSIQYSRRILELKSACLVPNESGKADWELTFRVLKRR